LLPGQYSVTVEAASGFTTKVFTDVSVSLGQSTDLPVALSIGVRSETVTVTSTGEELVNRDQSQISTTFETRKIEDLPSNGAGSGIDTLALLAPGVIASRNSGVNTDGAGLSVNGNRGRSNNFQIDGSDNNDLSIGGPSLFVDNTSQVQEYQVITNNFSAQYGSHSWLQYYDRTRVSSILSRKIVGNNLIFLYLAGVVNEKRRSTYAQVIVVGTVDLKVV